MTTQQTDQQQLAFQMAERKCRTCGGKGKTEWAVPWQKENKTASCPNCNGTGNDLLEAVAQAEEEINSAPTLDEPTAPA